MLQRFEFMNTARSFPQRVLFYAELWMGGMFLQDEAYVYMRERRNPFASGLLYVALVGVLVALGGILGAAARYLTSPSVDAIKNTVLVHLQAMPFYETMGAAAQSAFEAGFQQTWEWFGQLFMGYPTSPMETAVLFLGVLTTPIGLVLTWVIFGALVHLVARRWNPEISFSEMLGPLALALSSQLLNVLHIFPNVGINALVVALWFFVSAVSAIRVTYKTTQANALRAAFIPILVLLLLLIVLVMLGAFAVGARGGQ